MEQFKKIQNKAGTQIPVENHCIQGSIYMKRQIQLCVHNNVDTCYNHWFRAGCGTSQPNQAY